MADCVLTWCFAAASPWTLSEMVTSWNVLNYTLWKQKRNVTSLHGWDYWPNLLLFQKQPLLNISVVTNVQTALNLHSLCYTPVWVLCTSKAVFIWMHISQLCLGLQKPTVSRFKFTGWKHEDLTLSQSQHHGSVSAVACVFRSACFISHIWVLHCNICARDSKDHWL